MGIFSFFSNKTAKKSNKEDFNHLFTQSLLINVLNSSNSMVLFFSKTDGWIGANKKFYKEMGYKNINDFRRRNNSVRDIFVSESEEIFTEDDKSWLDYLKKHKSNGYDVRLHNAEDKILDVKLKSMSVDKKNSIYILEFEDVTKLKLANIKTNEVEKLKTKFLANIGHEFRTPMNGIIGFIELLSGTDLNKTQKEYLHLIENSSRSLMSNIETLLDLSQMQGGRLTIDTDTFELIPHMEELVYQHILVARDRGVKLINFIDPKLPRELEGDIRKIKQVINSLLQNAIKFTPIGGRVLLEVKLLKRKVNGDCTIGFGVKDNGKGISKHDISNILEPFTSGDQADERLGVGLSLAHGLVQLLGSNLHIQTQENEGSYFNFVLSFKATKEQSYKMLAKQKVKVLLLDNTKMDEANALSSYLRSFSVDVIKSNLLDEDIFDGIEALYVIADQSDSSWMFRLGTLPKKVPIVMLLEEDEKLQTKLTHIVDEVIVLPMFPSTIARHLSSMHGILLEAAEKLATKMQEKVRALVVEDNLINQKLMQLMLKEYDINVHTASNGNEAIDMCKRNQFDIVFMDIDLPEKNGIVATKEIKQTVDLNGKTPIIAFTAMAMQGDKEMLLREGLDDYLSKPITREKLQAMLNKYLLA